MKPDLTPRYDCPEWQMKAVDRMGWETGSCFLIRGLNIGIRTNCRSILADICRCLPEGWKPFRPPLVQDALYAFYVAKSERTSITGEFHQLFRDARQIARSKNLAEIFAALEKDIQSWVTENARKPQKRVAVKNVAA